MLNRRYMLWAGAGALALFAGDRIWRPAAPRAAESFAVTHTDAEWRGLLTPAQYQVLRLQGTERAFSSPLDHETLPGIFACAGCDLPLFSSKLMSNALRSTNTTRSAGESRSSTACNAKDTSSARTSLSPCVSSGSGSHSPI